jgi:hypothetical protein
LSQNLHEIKYSLLGNHKTEEGDDNPDPNAQFRHTNHAVKRNLARGWPVISVDTKRKQSLGNYQNAAQQWRPDKQPHKALGHDIPSLEGPHLSLRFYDIGQNTGLVKSELVIGATARQSAARMQCRHQEEQQRYKESWIGYKLHTEAADGQIPIRCILTSASPPDSQAAIPPERMTARRVTSLSDLSDSAYDAPPIHEQVRALSRVPIIDINPRRQAQLKVELQAEAKRQKLLNFDYPEECALSRTHKGGAGKRGSVKEESDGRSVWVRCNAKVMCHHMFGIVAPAADQALRLIMEATMALGKLKTGVNSDVIVAAWRKQRTNDSAPLPIAGTVISWLLKQMNATVRPEPIPLEVFLKRLIGIIIVETLQSRSPRQPMAPYERSNSHPPMRPRTIGHSGGVRRNK